MPMRPLAGVKIIEFAGIGPGPMCAMLLADLGADIVRVDRIAPEPVKFRSNILNRNRPSISLDLKHPDGKEAALKLVEGADALIEGFRPGVMERLGLGPDDCLARNPKIVYGRMTGWGQEGPLAMAAGHDINYIALTGALHSIGPKDGPPSPPLNVIGDFGGGALYLALGVVSAVLNARLTGKGQVLDVAMVDGAASLITAAYGLRSLGLWKDQRGSNTLDGGAYYYGAYETKDGKYISIASIEPQFYAELVERLGLKKDELPAQHDRDQWPAMRTKLEALFRRKTRDEWCAILEGTDVCFGPVLTLGEAPEHPHNKARNAFIEIDGVVQPAPAPRFAGTPLEIRMGPPEPGANTADTLAAWGFSKQEVATLLENGVAWQNPAKKKK
jgi:alpha-methylacyl-CoA racemase